MATEILRKATQTVDKFEVGDQLAVTFPDREYTATAIQLVGDGEAALVLLDDFLDEPYPMNRKGGTEGGYEASDARKHLQEIAEQLPEDFKAKLIPFENGDLLRLLTLTEMTGEDENWNEADGQGHPQEECPKHKSWKQLGKAAQRAAND